MGNQIIAKLAYVRPAIRSLRFLIFATSLVQLNFQEPYRDIAFFKYRPLISIILWTFSLPVALKKNAVLIHLY